MNTKTAFDREIQVSPKMVSEEEAVSDNTQDSSALDETNSESALDKQSVEAYSKDENNDSSKVESPPNDLPSTHTYHLKDGNGDEVFCSYDSNKQQFVENVRNDVRPRIFTKDGKQIQ